jgi:hypothetical protein
MTTTTNPHPNVPVPAGAVFADDWEGDEPQRVVTGPNRGITDHPAFVRTVASQRADGTVNVRPAPGIEAPGITVFNGAFEIVDGLNSGRARELAAVLLEAADELDGWADKGEDLS